MDRKQAKELLPIIQAFADGRTIQAHIYGEWRKVTTPSFCLDIKYRVKPEPPEPRVLYVNEYDGTLAWTTWLTKEKAGAVRGENSDNAKTVKFIEVRED